MALLRGDYMATYDLSAMYHHVLIHEDLCTFLGFCVPGEASQADRYFCLHMYAIWFGFGHTLPCTPHQAHLFLSGPRRHTSMTAYINDGIILAMLHELALQHLLRTLDVLAHSGFIVAENNSAVILAKRLAKVLGKAITLETALGPVVQLLTRSAQSELAATVKAAHWGVTVWLSEDARQIFQLLSASLSSFNGHTIKTEATPIPLHVFLEHSPYTENVRVHVWILCNLLQWSPATPQMSLHAHMMFKGLADCLFRLNSSLSSQNCQVDIRSYWQC